MIDWLDSVLRRIGNISAILRRNCINNNKRTCLQNPPVGIIPEMATVIALILVSNFVRVLLISLTRVYSCCFKSTPNVNVIEFLASSKPDCRILVMFYTILKYIVSSITYLYFNSKFLTLSCKQLKKEITFSRRKEAGLVFCPFTVISHPMKIKIIVQ